MRKLPNLRHLRALDAVCRTQSINAAAAEVNITQPAVTQALAKLEEYFGARLFVRRSDGTYATEAGALLGRRVARFRAQVVSAISIALGPAARSEASVMAVANRLTASQLHALIAVARTGSYSQAAQALGMAEPSLHRVARDLEHSIGRTLYFRSLSGIGANRTGYDLARRWALARLEIEQAIDEMRGLEGVASGRVAIGSLPLARTLILPRAISRASEAFPDASFEIIDGPYETLLRNLREGVTDFLVGALRDPPPFEDIVGSELLRDPYAVVARCGHPLFARRAIGIADLAEYAWVIPREGTPVRAAFEALFAEGPKPSANIETSSLVATRGILLESDRLTLLSHRQIAIEERVKLLDVLPFPLPDTSRPIGVTTRSGWLPSPVHEHFLDCLRRAAGEA